MKNKVLVVFVLLALLLVLSACTTSSQPDMQPTEDQPQVEEVEVDQEDVVDEEEQEPAAAGMDAAALYDANCARCHGADRSGRNGPALLPSQLSQNASVYEGVVLDGRGKMPAFGNRLSEEEIIALVEFILTEPQ